MSSFPRRSEVVPSRSRQPPRTTPTLHILLVEDNPGDARLLEEMLREGTLLFSLARADRLAATRAHLRDAFPDVILLDLSLPDSQGMDTVRAMLESSPTVPILVLSGLDDEEVAVAAVDAGAQDYLVKGQVTPELLSRSIRYAVQRKRLELERTLLLEREQQARAAAEAASRARDEVLAIVAHDLRNPLAAVTMGVSMLLPEEPDEQVDLTALRSTLEMVLRASEGMDRLIGDLLDLTRIEAGRLAISATECEVGPVLTEVRELFTPAAIEKKHQFLVSIVGVVPPVLADRNRLIQVFSNLVANAIKFTPPPGRIVVEAAAVAGGVRFTVSDTGPGLPADMLAHVFDRFWQARNTRHQGTGLGLTIARGIVEAHGGDIWVESEEGSGAAFAFTVPAAPGSTAAERWLESPV